jgi:hypothetical protein
MRKACTLVASLLIGCSLTASAQSTPPRTSRIERRLDTLAVSFAKALADRPVRQLVRRSIAASETKTEVRLRDLLDRQVVPGSTFAARLAAPAKSGAEARLAALRLLGDTPDVDVSVLPSLAAWKIAGEAPLVAYTWEGAGPEERGTLRAFDAAGNLTTLDARQAFDHPVIVLEVHDNRGSVQTADVPAPTGELPVKELNTCYDSATYSSYPLITGAAIWDAHESSFDGPKGFLYFVHASSEKTGNLPASLGGLSGWDTDVWASNFQGPYREEKDRMQWEWTADGSIETCYRHYPAVFCQQSASTPSGFYAQTYAVREDDDWGNPDDSVGGFEIDHTRCKTDVFDQGIDNGWSSEYSSTRMGDINNVNYKLFCETHRRCTATAPCADSSAVVCTAGGTCGTTGACESGSGYVRCGGTYTYCPTPTCNHGICDPL